MSNGLEMPGDLNNVNYGVVEQAGNAFNKVLEKYGGNPGVSSATGIAANPAQNTRMTIDDIPSDFLEADEEMLELDKKAQEMVDKHDQAKGKSESVFNVPDAPEKKDDEGPKFTNEEKQALIREIIKPGGVYYKSYEMVPGFIVTMRTISDAELHTLNSLMQGIVTKGQLKRQRTYFSADQSTEIDVYHHQDHQRSIRRVYLATYIHTITSYDKTQGGDLDYQAKLEWLLSFNPTLLDLIYEGALANFLQLLAEATKEFKNF